MATTLPGPSPSAAGEYPLRGLLRRGLRHASTARPPCAGVMDALAQQDLVVLRERVRIGPRLASASQRRPIAVDPVPRLIGGAAWEALEAGLVQRARRSTPSCRRLRRAADLRGRGGARRCSRRRRYEPRMRGCSTPRCRRRPSPASIWSAPPPRAAGPGGQSRMPSGATYAPCAKPSRRRSPRRASRASCAATAACSAPRSRPPPPPTSTPSPTRRSTGSATACGSAPGRRTGRSRRSRTPTGRFLIGVHRHAETLVHRPYEAALFHVHVGVPDAEAAIRAANRLRSRIPLLLALSVNSPFWQGRDSGLASARTPLFQAFPRVGIPRAFADYARVRRGGRPADPQRRDPGADLPLVGRAAAAAVRLADDILNFFFFFFFFFFLKKKKKNIFLSAGFENRK